MNAKDSAKWTLLMGTILAAVSVAANAPPNDLVIAYYYPWYIKGDWNRHGHVDAPALGLYGTDDPATAESHIETAAQFGIDAFFVSWWGHDSLTDKHARAGLLQADNLNKIRFAMYYEAFGILDPVDGKKDSLVDFSNPAVLERVIADFLDLKRDYFVSESYLKIGEKPVVGIYVTRGFRNFKPEHIAALEAAIGVDLYLIADEAFLGRQSHPDTAQNSAGFDAYSAYNMFENGLVQETDTALTYMRREALPVFRAWADNRVFLPGLMPSYHDFRGNRPLPGTAAQFRDMIRDMQALPHKPISPEINQIYLLTSFNEWWEGTTIEPGGTYGTSYLEVIRDCFPPTK